MTARLIRQLLELSKEKAGCDVVLSEDRYFVFLVSSSQEFLNGVYTSSGATMSPVNKRQNGGFYTRMNINDLAYLYAGNSSVVDASTQDLQKDILDNSAHQTRTDVSDLPEVGANPSVVSFDFRQARPKITFAEFQAAYERQYNSEFFKNPFSTMRQLFMRQTLKIYRGEAVQPGKIEDIELYCSRHPNSRSVKVLARLEREALVPEEDRDNEYGNNPGLRG